MTKKTLADGPKEGSEGQRKDGNLWEDGKFSSGYVNFEKELVFHVF